eukprot:15838-Amphidinium_carterae.2
MSEDVQLAWLNTSEDPTWLTVRNNHKQTCAEVEKSLVQYRPPLAPQRTNVQHPNKPVRSATFGAYCVRGYGITTHTTEHPEVVVAVHRLASSRRDRVPYLSFQITEAENGLAVHRDGANLTRSHIVALGQFSAGHLHVATARGQTQLPEEYHVANTNSLKFTKFQIRTRWLAFDPTTYHAVSAPSGRRLSVTLYTPRAFTDLSSDILRQLEHLGFSVPPPPSPQSDLALTQSYPTEARERAKEGEDKEGSWVKGHEACSDSRTAQG